MSSVTICVLVAVFGCLTAKGIAFPLEAVTVTSLVEAGPLTLLDVETSSQLSGDHSSAANEKLQRSTRNLGLGFGGLSGKFGGLGHGFGSFGGLGFGLAGFHGLAGGLGGFKPFFHKLG